tara:strand:+ start:1793 stop:2032 length:240 start_codon:yes stop_codon:yes gene_type:complete
MGYCLICETEEAEGWFGKWCVKCRRIKHLINLYGLTKVSEVLERVLVRKDDKMEYKIKDIVKEEYTKKGYNLREKKTAE